MILHYYEIVLQRKSHATFTLPLPSIAGSSQQRTELETQLLRLSIHKNNLKTQTPIISTFEVFHYWKKKLGF